MDELNIRTAAIADAPRLLAIYAPYVENTAVSFEYEVPSPEVFRGRMEKTLEEYPYLVAEVGGVIVGYAYAGRFHPREAYRWGAETTIYVEQGMRGRGVGRALYEALERALKDMGILNLNACIAHPETEDEHLTADSERFHARMGYQTVAEFHQCGYKFGTWYNMIWMEKMIGEHTAAPAPVKPFSRL